MVEVIGSHDHVVAFKDEDLILQDQMHLRFQHSSVMIFPCFKKIKGNV